MINLIKIFYTNPKYRAVAYTATTGVTVLTFASVYLSYLFLNWYGTFYNALQMLDYTQFISSMYSFCILAGCGVVLDSVFKYVNQKTTFIWRKCLLELAIAQLNKLETPPEGYAQRIQEDTMRFTRIVESLYVGVLRSISSVIVFTPILWQLSNQVFPSVPGLLWFLALFYSIGGIIISWLVGRYLPVLEFNNQVKEAAFRTSLEKLQGGYEHHISSIQASYYALYNSYLRFSFWANSFFQASVIFPYLICGSALFAKLITLGTLVQISKAFDNIQSSLAYLVERWTDITELRSVILRLNIFFNDEVK